MQEDYSRQSQLFVPQDVEHRHLDLVGAGALGGAILLALVKMGFGVLNRITLTDFDRCAMHNLPNQWFRQIHVLARQSKVEALLEMAAFIGERDVVGVDARFDGDENRPLGPVVVLAIDSLEERARIWQNLKRRDDVELLVDARMGGEVLEVYALDPRVDSPRAFEQSLNVLPQDVYEVSCGQQAIFYTVLGAGSYVASILRRWSRGQDYPRHLLVDFGNFFARAEGGPRGQVA